jgi:hypothetical protein
MIAQSKLWSLNTLASLDLFASASPTTIARNICDDAVKQANVDLLPICSMRQCVELQDRRIDLTSIQVAPNDAVLQHSTTLFQKVRHLTSDIAP